MPKIVGIRPDVSAASAALEQTVSQAVEAMNAAAMQAEVTHDPIASSFRAQSLMLQALRDVSTETMRALTQAREPPEPIDPAAFRTLTERMAKAGTAAMERRADDLVAAVRLRTKALIATAGFGLLLAGSAAGWVARRWSDPPVAITNCVPAPQALGGQAWTCTFWTRPPGVR